MRRWLALLVLSSLCACGKSIPAPPPDAPLFHRVAVLGASLSAGFGGAPVAELVNEGIGGKHEVKSYADTFFFSSPFEKGRAQVTRAAQYQPTVVIALDSLFWYVYVSGASEQQRLERLEAGMKMLEGLSAPVLVGDIPYMRDAHPMMLAPEAIPPPAQIERFNQRIRAWAGVHANVYVAPLSKWVEPLLRGEEVVVEPGKAPRPAAELMTSDRLHPNRAGVLYVLRKLDAELERHFPDTPRDALRVPGH